MIRRVLIGLFAAIFLTVVCTGCNTVRGAGEDIEATGEAISGE